MGVSADPKGKIAAPAGEVHIDHGVVLSLRQIGLSHECRMIAEGIEDTEDHVGRIHIAVGNGYLVGAQRHRPVLSRHVQRHVCKPVQLLLPHGTHMELAVRRHTFGIHFLRGHIVAVEDDEAHFVLYIIGKIPAAVGAEGTVRVQGLKTEEMLVELRLRQRLGVIPRAAEGGVGGIVVALDHQAAILDGGKGRAELVDIQEKILGQAVTRA